MLLDFLEQERPTHPSSGIYMTRNSKGKQEGKGKSNKHKALFVLDHSFLFDFTGRMKKSQSVCGLVQEEGQVEKDMIDLLHRPHLPTYSDHLHNVFSPPCLLLRKSGKSKIEKRRKEKKRKEKRKTIFATTDINTDGLVSALLSSPAISLFIIFIISMGQNFTFPLLV
ncbi:hypothetical protein L873DRAFT_1229570 [Choiromyces venosus 120613-1]|uniref:Uncharacterized protein n=1 Tax=Choiromyces venosus 120613-1 TaxID=1336337 RepID=A0A3N4JDZ0_9PEZI|nr:hypothetical protein L873DRAFT_1229570 [Choiromyces venosus 120613-1]